MISIVLVIFVYSSFALKNQYGFVEECSTDIFPDVSDESIRYMIKNDYDTFRNLSYCMEKYIDCAYLNPTFAVSRLRTNAKMFSEMCKNYYKRTTVILADGTYFYDTIVNPPQENHNTRISVMTAQLSRCGVGWEKKFSTTTKKIEHYFTKRCDSPTTGWHLGSYVIRISK